MIINTLKSITEPSYNSAAHVLIGLGAHRFGQQHGERNVKYLK